MVVDTCSEWRITMNKWKDFKISEIFNTYTGASIPQAGLKKGVVPRITACETNNGVAGFFGEKNTDSNYRTQTNFISVSFLGGIFYQPYEASLDMKIHALKPKNIELNRYIAEYLIVMLKQTISKIHYGNQLSSSDLPNKRILLPILPNGNPDWIGMENYMRDIEKGLLNQYKSYLDTIENTQHKMNVKPNWKEFKLEKIFTICATKSGIDKINIKKGRGDIPYITRTDKNNGWDCFVGEQPKYTKDTGKVISVGLDTQTAFYQPIDFYTGQNIQVLSSDYLNRYASLFMLPQLRNLMTKFSWGGNGATLTRLRRSKILLPIDKNEEPYYEYMESFMRTIEIKQVRDYVNYLKLRIES